MRTKKPVSDEPSEIEKELLALTGSTANYNALLADIGEQLRAIAKTGHRIVMKGDKVVSVDVPEKKRPHRERRKD